MSASLMTAVLPIVGAQMPEQGSDPRAVGRRLLLVLSRA
jgi:hypothetical protein